MVLVYDLVHGVWVFGFELFIGWMLMLVEVFDVVLLDMDGIDFYFYVLWGQKVVIVLWVFY